MIRIHPIPMYEIDKMRQKGLGRVFVCLRLFMCMYLLLAYLCVHVHLLDRPSPWGMELTHLAWA